jgi:hypothetical protein
VFLQWTRSRDQTHLLHPFCLFNHRADQYCGLLNRERVYILQHGWSNGSDPTDSQQVVPTRLIQGVPNKLLRACCHQLVTCRRYQTCWNNLLRVCWPRQPCHKMITTCSRLVNNWQGWVDYKLFVVRYNYSYFKNM